MKYSDISIDLNDFWGRVFPGAFMLFDLLYAIYCFGGGVGVFIEESLSQLLTINLGGATLSAILFLMLCYVLGEIPLHLFFAVFRDIWFREKTAYSYIEELSVLNSHALSAFYERIFRHYTRHENGRRLYNYCKDSLLSIAPEEYQRARKIEARVNWKGGMLLPAILMAIFSVCDRIFSVTTPLMSFLLFWSGIALVGVFRSGYKKEIDRERKYVFLAYFIACNKQNISSIHTRTEFPTGEHVE